MRLEEATARVLQLEEDLIGVTQKGLQKETELDGYVQCADSLTYRVLLHMNWNECSVKSTREEEKP